MLNRDGRLFHIMAQGRVLIRGNVRYNKKVRLTSATGLLECSPLRCRWLKEHCATERNCVPWRISTAYGAVL